MLVPQVMIDNNIQNNSKINFNGRTQKFFMKTLELDEDVLVRKQSTPEGFESVKKSFLDAANIMRHNYKKENGVSVFFYKAKNKLIIREKDRRITISSEKFADEKVSLEYKEETFKNNYKIADSIFWFLDLNKKKIHEGEVHRTFKIKTLGEPENENFFTRIFTKMKKIFN